MKKTKKFIEKSIKRHGVKYDYSKAKYVCQDNIVTIICPIHGEFQQTAKSHLVGVGCKKCSRDRIAKASMMSFETFVNKANKRHNNEYTYDKDSYIKATDVVLITCPIHGEFKLLGNNHLTGYKCPKCPKRLHKNTADFVADAKRKHGDRYNYNLVEYKGIYNTVKIVCPIHGVFEQTPHSHLSGSNCQMCAAEIKSEKTRLTKDEFITRSKEIHKGKYGYDKVIYDDMQQEVTITCPIHGEFKQRVKGHLSGNGCKKCGLLTAGDKNRKTLETFISESNERHNGKYNYDKVVYINAGEKVIITCPIHGDFEQTPNLHLKNNGCGLCGKIAGSIANTSDTETFIKRATKKHNGKYGYDKTIYLGVEKKVIITCPIHGDFEQTPHSHLKSNGCLLCGIIDTGKSNKMSSEEYFKRAKEKHGDKYDYTNSIYIGSNKPITYVCPKHGKITQLANSHLDYECELCGKDKTKKDFDTFLDRANKEHEHAYTYDEDSYTMLNSSVKITCKKHGEFTQLAQDHVRGTGCPVCSESKGERAVRNLLFNNKITYIREYKFNNSRYRYDFYLPELNILIEYDGVQHFKPIEVFGGIEALYKTQIRDKEKDILADANNIPLIRIPYTEIKNIREYLFTRIKRYYKYVRNGSYFKNFLELAKHLNLNSNAMPRDYEKYKLK